MRSLRSSLALLTLLAAPLLTTGCGKEEEETPATTTPVVKAKPRVIHAFDPAKYEFVEGLEVVGSKVFVGSLPTGVWFQFDDATGSQTGGGAFPRFTANQGSLVGIAVDSAGTLYGALNVTDPAGPKTGVYKVGADGTATLFASSPEMYFVNDIKPIEGGALLVTDSISGTIFHVTSAGVVSTWLKSPLLTPSPTTCNETVTYHLGVNGLVKRGDAWFATNTDQASIVRIPVGADGKAGTPETYVATDCAGLFGVDGIAVDPASQELIVAVNYRNRVVRIDASKKVTTLLADGEIPVQSPASVAIRPNGEALVTCAAFAALATDPSKAKPALLAIPLSK